METIKYFAAIAVFFFSTIALAAPVNINTASAEEIAAALDGVGMHKAQAIVEYRETYGEFSRADEIVFVRGIGEATFDKNRNDILVK